MNYMIFLSLLNLVLLSRLRLLFKDYGATKKDALIMGALPLIILPFLQINFSWVLLLAWLTASPWLFLISERNTEKLNRNRLLTLLMQIVVLSILASPLLSVTLNTLPVYISGFINEVILLHADGGIDWIHLQVLVFGFLLVINESNILLRYLLDLFRLKPISKKGTDTDEKEYSTGRLIGILERIFVVIFVLLGQFTAIGFILAAKGVARFQDFKSRTFAEYVLIGTLLSTLFAMAAGYLVMLLLN